MKLANHPDMQKYVQSMVGEQLKVALEDPSIAARILDQH